MVATDTRTLKELRAGIGEAETGVDARSLAQMTYANGATGQFMCGIDVMGTSHMTIYTDKAVIPKRELSENFQSIVRKLNKKTGIFPF